MVWLRHDLGSCSFYEVVADWTIYEGIDVFETGSDAQFHELLTDLEAAHEGGQGTTGGRRSTLVAATP
jgi:hypothetical protein